MATWTLNGTTATCTDAAANTKITVTGVKSTDGLSIDGTNVIVSSASLGTEAEEVTISCTQTETGEGKAAATTYALALGTDIPKKVKTGATAAWKVSGTTATYEIAAVADYYEDNGTIKHETGHDAGTFTYATVTGLKSGQSGLTDADAEDALKVSGNNITVNANAFDNANKNSKVNLTNGTDATGTAKTYKLVLDSTVNNDSYEWTYSGTNAEYKQTRPLQFESSGTEITMVKGSKAATATLAKLAGLKKGLSDIDSVLTVSGNTITVKTDALTSTTVKLTNQKDVDNTTSTYKLAVTGDYLKSDAAAVPAWVVNSSTAKYYTDTTAFTQVPGYAVTDTQITYTAAKVDSKASPAITITNLNSSGLVLDATGQVSGITIDALTTKVKIANSLLNKNKILLSGADSNGKAYTFDVSDNENIYETSDTDIEATKNGKNIEFKQTIGTGYTLSSNGKSIFYNGKTEDQTISIAKISGINADWEWDDEAFDPEKGVITLSDDALSNGKVTITGDAGYTLAIDATVNASETGTDPELVLNKNTATYGIHTTEGYELSADSKTLTYVKDSVKAQATITGVNASLYDIAKQAVASDTTSTVYAVLTNGEIDEDKVATYHATEIAAAEDEDAAKDSYVAQEQAKYDKAIAAKVATYIKFDKTAGTVTLSKEALGTSAIKLKITKDADDYDLKLASGIITSKEDSEQESNYVTTWEVKGTNATYQTYKPAYYQVTSSKAGDKDIKYNKAIAVNKTPDIALSGLAKDLSVVKEGTDGISGIALDTTNKVVTLDLKVLGTGTIKVTKGDYTLALNESTFDTTTFDTTGTTSETTDDISTSKYSFTPKGTGKFELTQTKTEGYELAADKKSVTLITSKSKKDVAVATLTGISGSSITIGTDVTLDHENRTITITSEDLLGNVTDKAKLAVSGSGGYTLLLDSSLKASAEENWVVEKGKVIYRQTITGSGFAVSADGKSITAVTTETKAVDLFTITGLNTEALDAIETDPTNVSKYVTLGNDGTIELSKYAVGSSAIKLATKGKYTLALAGDIKQTEDTSGTSKGWVVKGKEATYQNIAQGYYTLDAKKTSVTYKPPTAGSGSATVTLKGLKGGLKVNGDGTITGIKYSGSKSSKITLSAEVLGGTDVSVEGNVELALAKDVEKSTENAPVWTIKKTTATYTQKPASGYAVSEDKKSITYTKPGATITMATLTGLPTSVGETLGENVELKADDVEEYIVIDGNEITVTDELVGTSKSITLKNGKDASGAATTYTLAIDSSLEPSEDEEVQWYVKNTTAQYINCTNTHYVTAKNDTVINRVDVAPVAGATALLTINGIKKGSVLTNSNATVSTSTVTLSNDLLSNATVTLVGTGDYENCKLAFKDATSYTTAEKLTTKWSTSGTKATLKQSKEAGYSLSADGKTMTYLKAPKEEVVASVSGLAKDKKMETKLSNGSVTDLKLTTTDLSKAVTVDGNGYKFIFDANYSGTAANAINTIKGGAKVDNIQAAGNYLKIETAAGDDIVTATGSDNVINAGKGDDTITLGTGSNTIIYNSGDGNDVIKNYASDTIQVNLTAAELAKDANDISYSRDGENIVLTVKKGNTVGTMTLTGVTDISNVKVVDKAGGEVTLTAPTTEPTGSDFIGSGLVAEEFYDTNYIGSANDLGDIISGDATFSVGDIETSDATDLTKQNTTIVASTGK